MKPEKTGKTMGDDNKLKQELYYMVRLTSKYDFTNMELVESILRLENERHILNSVFGNRFKRKIFDIAAGVDVDDKCVICGLQATNKVICPHCMETIGDSEYAKQALPQENQEDKSEFNNEDASVAEKNTLKSVTEKIRKAFSLNKVSINGLDKKYVIKVVLAICLMIILFIQLWILSLWHEIKKYNPSETPIVSSVAPTPVSSPEEAAEQLALDFPENQGYTITFARMDTDFVGRFTLENGACCEEAEEKLLDEEKYDYYFTEEVYIFYISYNEEFSAKVGLAEVNSEGNIIVLGSFNDGRKTNLHYKIR